MTPNRPKTDKGRYYILNLILLKNEPQIGRRPIMKKIIFQFISVEKLAQNRPKADNEENYISI
jgi:hypothetical protein